MAKASSPYGLHIIQSCLSCPVREEGLFCHLGTEALTELNALRQVSLYPKGSLLYVQDQEPRGIYVLCSGSAKLTTTSASGSALIVRVAETGDVLGLTAVITNAHHLVSAETLEPTEANFLPRQEFLRFLQKHGDVSLRVAEILSREVRRAYEQLARIALAPTARAKLAGLLLEWANSHARPTADGLTFHLHLTHEELGELIGSSRETVTRLLSDFQREGLLEVRGALITIPQPAKLEDAIT